MEAVKMQIAATTTTGDGTKVTPDMVDTEGERAQGLYAIYSGLGYNTIFWSLVLILLAWLALRRGRVVRAFATVILVFSVLFKAADPFIAMPVVSLIADALVVVVAVTAIVFFFRRDITAYYKSR
ncbi:MAG TPA: hypothetical protein VFV66_06295 [Nonomuraea sp.]|nr:hypothetical protein [Nonomuraea sp.]